jgi:hypothetical protein
MDRPDPTPPDLSVSEVAKRLDVSMRTVTHWISRGYFPNAYPVNPRSLRPVYRIPLADVKKFESERQPVGDPSQRRQAYTGPERRKERAA